MYIGLNTPYGTNNFLNYILDLLTKVLPKAVSGLARSALARRSGNETSITKNIVFYIFPLTQIRLVL